MDSIISSDIEGNIIDLNRAAELMLGYSREELLNKPASILCDSEEESNTIFQKIEVEGSFLGEVFCRTKDGRKIICRLSANQLQDELGNIIGTMGVSKDITHQVSMENEYKSMITNVSDVLYSTTSDGFFTFLNATVQNILGYSVEELIGTSFRDLIHETDLNMVDQHYLDFFRKKLSRSYLEFKLVKKDGDILWVGQHVSSKLHKHRIIGFYGMLRDIDKQKKSEMLLSESEEKYRELFDNSSDLIQSIDATGKFLYVNQKWKDVMGFSDAEIEHINLFSLIHPGTQEHCSKVFENILRTGVCQESRVVYELLAKNGQTIIVEGAINVKNKNGKVISIQTFLRDITIQRASEILLAKQENTLRQITETINDVFYLFNLKEQKYEYISPNCCSVLGANEAFFPSGKNYSEKYVNADDFGSHKDVLERVEAGSPIVEDYQIIINGETKWINEKSFPIQDSEGNIIALSGICRDITDIRKAQEIIENQKDKIESSILYAKRIQDAVLPSEGEINSIFTDSFVLFQPKDVVSGDFYIVDKIFTNEDVEMPVLFVGDCTGHGVPGAVLSLMCTVLIRESFTRHDIASPAEALDYTRNKLMDFFRTNGVVNIRDGMDCSYCVLDMEKNLLSFSGANNSCLIIRNNEILVYKGDKQHVGFDDNTKPFTNYNIDLQKGDSIFLYTDGYYDQFGGEKDKKFKKNRFHELLLANNNLPMLEIKNVLTSVLNDWMEGYEQTDDITILGIRI